jgi:cyclase
MMSVKSAPVATTLALILALPASAQEPASQPVPEAGYVLHVQPIVPGLQVLSGGGCNVAVWSGVDGVVLVDDAQAAATPALLESVAGFATGPVRFVINTHWHPDHTGANEAVARAGGVVIAQNQVRTRMSEAHYYEEGDLHIPAAPKEALPVVTFEDSVSLHLNGDVLSASHVVDAHTDGDVIAWWEKANVVSVGDVYYSGSYPFIDLDSGGSLAGMVAAIEVVLERADARTVIIPGHGPLSNRAELVAYRDMLVAVGRRVRELLEDGKSLDEVLAAHPTAAYDARFGHGSTGPERFVRLLYADFTGTR